MSGAAVRGELADLVSRQVLLCDGAMGTLLHAVGNSLDQALVELNLSNPELVRAIHDRYVDAGVDIIQTNTFGASRARLATFGFSDEVEAINRAGVRIARAAARAASRRVFVAGSVSPAVTSQQRRRSSAAEREGALRAQIEVLADERVDLLILETFGYLDELLEAVAVAASITDLPIVAQATFGADGRTLSDHSPKEVAQALSSTPLLAMGLNCTLGPHGSLAVVQQLAQHSDLPLTAQPNAGMPRRVSPARFEYEVESDYFARYAQKLVGAGAVIVGGCCGTTPDHIRAVADVVSEHRVRHHGVASVIETGPPVTESLGGVAGPEFTVAVQIPVHTPEHPESATAEGALRRAGLIRDAGVGLIAVTAAASSRAQLSSVNVAAQVQDRLKVRAIAGITTWSRSIMALQAQLLGAHSRGVTRIICETGNPLPVGEYPHADGRWDVDSVNLIELLAGLNDGVDHNGLRLASRTRFEIGARINPGAQDLDSEIRRTAAKIEAGATFLITRPIYEASALLAMLEYIDDTIPVLACLRPLANYQEAEYLRHEVPDVVIPEQTLHALERAGGAQRQVGLDVTAELASSVSGAVHGLLVAIDADDLAVLRTVLEAVSGAAASGDRA